MTGPLQALVARYDRLAAKGEVPAYGFSWEKISYAIVLGLDGTVVDLQPLLDTSARKPLPTLRLVPQSFKRSGTEPKSFFLWDNTKFILGVTKNQNKQADFSLAPRHRAAFGAFHAQLLTGSDDPGLRALIAFLGNWDPERFVEPMFRMDMLDTNLVFRLDGDAECSGKPRFLHQRPSARELWLQHLDMGESTRAMCLVSGLNAPIARVHPAIKIPGTKIANLSIVAFNHEAFTSYGKERGDNAPISTAAAFAYTTILNELARIGTRNSVRIADTTVMFWAETEEAETVVRGFFDPPAPDDQGEAVRVRAILEQMAKGRPIEQVAPELDRGTRFYILGLCPNAARLSVRFWSESTFGELAERFQAWWHDLRIEPEPWNGRLPAIWRLLYDLAPQRKAENVPAHLAGELTRAILTGRPLPRSLLASVVIRLRADHDVNGRRADHGRRAALCKAVLVRDLRLAGSTQKEDYLVSLDPHEANPGYRLGRLFAVLENVQRSALGRNVNATIRDRYYGAASATPASVFPVLIRTSNHHLANLRKGGKGGLAYKLEREMGGILDGLGATFPRNLRIEDQGRFAIGYYHERFSRVSALRDAVEAADITDTTVED